MTRQAQNNYRCHNCDIDLICPHCKNPQAMGTPFSLWLRGLPPPLDSSSVFDTDMDHVWFNYREGWFITIEDKINGKTPRGQQQEVLDIVSEKLSRSSPMKHQTIRGERPIEYRGHYTIAFEKTNPDDSKWIKINNHLTDKSGILLLLKWGIYPNSGDLPDLSDYYKDTEPVSDSKQYLSERQYLDLIDTLKDIDNCLKRKIISESSELELLKDDLDHLKHYIYGIAKDTGDIKSLIHGLWSAIEGVKSLILQLSKIMPFKNKQKQLAKNGNRLPLLEQNKND